MRHLLFLVLIASAGLGFTQPSLAQIVDGNRVAKECEAEDKTAIGYFIAGVIDTAANDKAAVLAKSLQYSVNTSPVPPDLTKGILKEMRSFCLVPPLDAEHIREVVCTYVKSNPKSLNLSAARLAVEALQAAYPCKSG